MSGIVPREPGHVLWRLNNPSGDELTCEIHRTDTAVTLRFLSRDVLLGESPPITAASLECWTRVWRAYYLTNGWADPGVVLPRRRARKRPMSPPLVGSGDAAILRYWTMTDRAGATVACELVRTAAGLEVRCNGRPQRAQLVYSMADGLRLAGDWQSAYQADARFIAT